MEFEKKVKAILSKSRSRNSVIDSLYGVIDETVTNLVDRLNKAGVPSSFVRVPGTIEFWSVEVDGYKFNIDGTRIVTISREQNVDISNLVMETFIEDLEETISEEE
ncbi:hypothetical protein [Paenibacillus xylanilyticus]|uniref:hypothetical protein n=1 Tax=Paenibacillus xylanilyticus TaxID=248903 RepID=UPI00129ED427|nr:hypothetical protein [Paenibacillus xylanilyticus]